VTADVFDRMVIVIGAMKAGTTSLHTYLDAHPDIHMSKLKELDFFVESKNWRRGVDWYRAQLDPSAPLNGESSPNYTKAPTFAGVPARMHGLVPKARLVYVVRDPVARIVSHYLHNVESGRERRSLDEVLAGDVREQHYVQASRYHHQLQQYAPYYDLDSILVVASEDLSRRRRPTLQRIFAFLDVDTDVDDPAFDEVRYQTAGRRAPTSLSLAVQRLPGGRKARAALTRVIDRPLPRTELSDALRDRLADALADDVEALRRQTGQAFADWSV
jgi:hypothetical protein